jgi:hypothetical protein
LAFFQLRTSLLKLMVPRRPALPAFENTFLIASAVLAVTIRYLEMNSMRIVHMCTPVAPIRNDHFAAIVAHSSLCSVICGLTKSDKASPLSDDVASGVALMKLRRRSRHRKRVFPSCQHLRENFAVVILRCRVAPPHLLQARSPMVDTPAQVIPSSPLRDPRAFGMQTLVEFCEKDPFLETREREIERLGTLSLVHIPTKRMLFSGIASPSIEYDAKFPHP